MTYGCYWCFVSYRREKRNKGLECEQSHVLNGGLLANVFFHVLLQLVLCRMFH